MQIGKKIILSLFLLFFSHLEMGAHDVYCSPENACDSVCPDPQVILKGRTFTIFSQNISMKFDTVAHNGFMIALDSFVIHSVSGLPDGITWAADCGLAKRCKFFPGSECLVIGGIPTLAGTYTVSINGDGYSASSGKFDLNIPTYTLIISEAVLDLSVQTTEVSSFGVCDGSASITASGGTPPYTYLWSTAETNDSISGKCSNKYQVVVTDSIGLTDSVNVYISEPSVTINAVPSGSATTVDTITGSIDTCIINCENPVDSARITSYTLLDSTHAIFDFTIYHYLNGNRVTLSTTATYTLEGLTRVRLQINCSGTFTKALKTCYIEDEIEIRYSEIGQKQTLVGTEEIRAKKEICKVFPNPFDDQLSFVLEEASGIKITDINGKEVYSTFLNAGRATINTSSFSAGFYFISIVNSGHAEIKKLIKH